MDDKTREEIYKASLNKFDVEFNKLNSGAQQTILIDVIDSKDKELSELKERLEAAKTLMNQYYKEKSNFCK